MKKISEISERIMALLKDLPQDEQLALLSDIHSKIPKANSRRIGKIALGKIADMQIAKLESGLSKLGKKGYIDSRLKEQIIGDFMRSKNDVVAKVSEMYIKEGNTPFIPVISKEILSATTQIELLNYLIDEKGAQIHLANRFDPTFLEDTIETPERAYWALDINNGYSSKRKEFTKLEEIILNINQRNRSILTLSEVIAIYIHTKPYSGIQMWASGTVHNISYFPLTILQEIIVPTYPDVSGDSYIPSCASRF